MSYQKITRTTMKANSDEIREIFNKAVCSTYFTRDYLFLSQLVRISCDSQAIDCFIKDYTPPYFEELIQGNAEQPAYHVVVKTDEVPEILITLFHHPTTTQTSIAWCFTDVSKQVALGEWRIIYDKDSGWILCHQDILIIWPNVTNIAGLTIVRFAREAIIQLATQNHIKLHAGMVSLTREHCALVTGDSGAGKTTLLMSLARRIDARLFANDRVLVGFAQGALIGYGTPLQSQVGERLLPAEILSLLDSQFYYIDSGDIAFWSKVGTFRKASLSPQLLGKLNGCTIHHSDSVSCVLVPELTLNSSANTQVIAVDYAERKKIFEVQSLNPDPAFPDSIYQFNLKRETTPVEEAILDLPWIRIKGNVDLVDLDSVVEEIRRIL